MERIDENGIWLIEDGVEMLIEPSQTWIDTNIRIPTRKELLIPIREERNKLLNECDLIYCNAERWNVMTDEQKQLWSVYKQELRDLPSVVDVNESVYPTKPE